MVAPTVNPGAFPLVVFALISVFTFGHSKPLTEYASDRQLGSVLTTVAFAGLALYTMTRVKTPRQSRFVLGCLAIGLTFGCLVGVLQNVANIDLHLLLQPPGFIDNTVDFGFGPNNERNGVPRSSGTASHPIEFSVLAAITVILNTYFIRHPGTSFRGWLAWMGVAIALLAVPAGVSRTGVIALTVGFVIFIWSFKVRTLLLMTAVVAVGILIEFAVAPKLLPALWETIIGSADDPSVLDRINDWAYVTRVFHEHPIFGIGAGVKKPGFADPTAVLDNQWLGELVDGGLVGVAGFAILTAGAIFGFPAALRMAASPEERNRAFAIGSMLIAIVATSVSFDLLGFQVVSFVFFILYGLLWSSVKVRYYPSGLLDIAY